MEGRNPFVVKASKRNPELRFLAVESAKVTYVNQAERKISPKTGEAYDIVQFNLMLEVPGACRCAYLTCTALYEDAALFANGMVKQGDKVTCLLDLDTRCGASGRSYQTVNVREIEIINENK